MRLVTSSAIIRELQAHAHTTPKTLGLVIKFPHELGVDLLPRSVDATEYQLGTLGKLKLFWSDGFLQAATEMSAELSRITSFLTETGTSATSSEQVVQNALDRIDKEIETVTLSLCSLRSWRNSLSHVSRLPPELLTAIFLEYALDWHFENITTYADQVPDWVFVSHVCRTWRYVAVNCPALWTRFFLASCRWVDELLARSKTFPISIYVDLSYVRSSEPRRALARALRHMDRIQHLWVCCSRADSVECLHQLSAAAPILRSFRLCLTPIGYPDQQISINEDTFTGSAPSLRNLSIERCRVDWSSPVLSGLTSLNLSRISTMSMLSMDIVIRTISRLPDLRQLRLEGSLPSAGTRSTDLRGVAKVLLPKLESVILIDSIFPIAALLAHLEFPRSAFVNLNCIYFASSNISILQPFIEERFNDSPRLSRIPRSFTPHILSLDLDYGVEKDAWCVACGTLNPDTYQTDCPYTMDEYLDTRPLLRLEFTERDFWFRGGRSESLISFCRTLPLLHIRRLTMCDSRHGDSSIGCLLTEALGDAPELRVIELRGSAHRLIRALFRDTTFAPALTNVELGNVKFSSSCTAQIPQEHPGSCVRCLRHVLASRAQVGLTLQTLIFNNCGTIGDDDVKGLREVVWQLEGVVVRERSVDSDISDVDELLYRIS
ncbi:hypothetical protein BKA83DRAFT_422960 [Pisolithus microcarpus]|nr:hypothetical protein BKA83DRAFT_422960 [Pisolithus microcarpus]